MIITENSDMSLSTLITSVERDIELLEQLQYDNDEQDKDENCSDHKDGEFSGSLKLLSWPGYKPKTNPQTMSSRPRQRHQSDSILSISSDREEDKDVTCVPLTASSSGERSFEHGSVTHTLDYCKPMYCPYCAGHFYHQNDLQDHLLLSHEDDLSHLQSHETKLFSSQTCPCCGAQFLKVSFSEYMLLILK